jgi:hypothetical protein
MFCHQISFREKLVFLEPLNLHISNKRDLHFISEIIVHVSGKEGWTSASYRILYIPEKIWKVKDQEKDQKKNLDYLFALSVKGSLPEQARKPKGQSWPYRNAGQVARCAYESIQTCCWVGKCHQRQHILFAFIWQQKYPLVIISSADGAGKSDQFIMVFETGCHDVAQSGLELLPALPK